MKKSLPLSNPIIDYRLCYCLGVLILKVSADDMLINKIYIITETPHRPKRLGASSNMVGIICPPLTLVNIEELFSNEQGP